MFQVKKYYLADKSSRSLISALFAILILISFPPDLFAQNQTQIPIQVFGSVKNIKGVPVMGALVQVQESTQSTSTDEDGNFEITVPTNSILNFEANGFISQSVTVTKSIIDVVLLYSQEGQGAKDKVYMPWAVTDKRSVTGSITTITQDELRKSPVMSLSSAVSGRLPGFTVVQQSGAPGNESQSWRIRGIRTLESGGTNNLIKGGIGTPIAIVDGFERSFTDFDASEIESFSILRDAAATSIYGLRGANGVILITTRRGQENKRTLDIEVSSGVVSPMRLPHFLGSYDYATLFNEARANDGLAPVYTYDDLIKYVSGASPLTHPDNDYYKEFINPATIQKKAALTMTGGNKLIKYFISLAYNNQNGLYNRNDEGTLFTSPSRYSRFNTRSNIDITVTKRLTALINIAGRIEATRSPYPSESSIFGVLSRYPPNAFPLSFNGVDPGTQQKIFMLGGNSIYTTNPLGQLSYTGYTKGTRRYYQLGIGFKYDLDFITKGLTANFQLDNDGYSLYNVSQSMQYLVWDRKEPTPGTVTYTSYNTASSLGAGSSSALSRWQGTNLNLNYDRTFGLHKIIGFAMLRRFATIFEEANQPDSKIEDYVLRANYSYNNRYFLEATATLSSSDNFFLTETPRMLFPAVSAAWILSDEPFLKESKIVPFLKVRASFGLSGNDSYSFTASDGLKARYPYRERWWSSSAQSIAYGIVATAASYVTYEGMIPNKNFTAEKARMANFGIDSKHFANRLSFSSDLWFEKRYNIYTRGYGSIPSTLGVLPDFLAIGNEGIVKSKGVEITLGWNDKIGNFNYWINGSVDYSTNKIEFMSEPARAYPWLVETGGQVRQDFGLVALGLFKNQAEIDASPVQLFGPYKPGDIKYRDLNSDNQIDALDYKAIGKGGFPTLSYSMDMGFKLKNFDFSMLWQGNSQRSHYLTNNVVRPFVNYGSISEYARNRYTDEASWATADFPRLTTMANDNNNRISTFWLKDATFIRLRNLEIGYSFENISAKKLGLNGMRVYLNAYNLLTFDNIKDFDPEDPAAGISKYPMTRIVNFGIILKF